MDLTQRQARELDYHRQHAAEHAAILDKPFDWAVLDCPSRRWWNAYWAMFDRVLDIGVVGRRVLVVGCGFGDDALRLAKLGARVSAFDLSPESLDIAARLARREGLTIDFQQMPAEKLVYSDAMFDLVLVRDILHHVDIVPTIAELHRVTKPGAVFVINEIYSHSWTESVRRSAIVERFLYPKMRRLVYGTDTPYITQDERKMTERDMLLATAGLQINSRAYFNFIVTRLVSDRSDRLARLDRRLMKVLPGRYLAGRALLVGRRR